MESIQPYLAYFGQNPSWAITVVFLIAFGEALLIIGLFVPSTAVLVGAGILVGAGQLEFWPVFLATSIGAILGDQVSYWAGRLYGQQLKAMWPLNRYPALVANGEEFVRLHGGKSIAIGRFVPGVKAVVPGIVGMLNMSQPYFIAVNFSSGLFWAAAHVFPGMLVGQGLALAGELSGRLVVVLLILLVILGIAGWLIRLFVGGLGPWVARIQHNIYVWSLTRREKGWRRLGRALAPHNPRAITIIVMGLVALAAGITLMRLAGHSLSANTFGNTDISISRMLQTLRNAPADELMVILTMLGDRTVEFTFAGAMALWLFWRRAWRAGIAVIAAVAFTEFFVQLMKDWIERPRPGIYGDIFTSHSFPSGHATMATVCFGMFAVLASRSLKPWGKAIVYSAAGIAAVAIAFSRVYLGAHWPTDVLGGLLFGAVVVAAFGIAIEAVPPRRVRPLGLAALALAAFAVIGSIHVETGYARQAEIYAPRSPLVRLKLAAWTTGAWAMQPPRRVDLAGTPEEIFIAQWAGDLKPMADALTAAGWIASPQWTWSASLSYLDPGRRLGDLLPRPALHEGRQAELTFIRPLTDDDKRRLVLRVFKTDFEIDDGSAMRPLYLVSVSRDVLKSGLALYAVPSVQRAMPEEVAAALAIVSTADRTAKLTATGDTGGTAPTLVLASAGPPPPPAP
jgi:undecaprenyl-diphosphatase